LGSLGHSESAQPSVGRTNTNNAGSASLDQKVPSLENEGIQGGASARIPPAQRLDQSNLLKVRGFVQSSEAIARLFASLATFDDPVSLSLAILSKIRIIPQL
jgi:hypothetical protein